MKRAALALSAVLVAAVLAACAPLFQADDVLTATPMGPLVKLTWGSAQADADKTVASYRIDVDGTAAATVPGTWTSCVLVGLSPSTSYVLSVTATDNTGGWSGNYSGSLASSGRLSAPYTTPAAGDAGPTLGCVSPTDTDADGLPDAVETNTGTYASAASTGTKPLVADSDGDRLLDGVETATGQYVSTTDTGSNPNVADTDGDAIRDGDEVLGTVAGLDLPGMGARPVKKDLLFELDWFDDNIEPATCAAHSHRPTAAAIGKLTTAFANAPVSNPNGTTGINVIADYGQGGRFTGGTLVADADGVIAGGVNNADFQAAKLANFAANREGYFHYVLMPHRYNTNSTSSGQAELPGDDLIVSLYCYGSDQNVANTIMHEVGHNLNLRHGGNVDLPNYKPNYNSVMNYQFQFPGIDTGCDGLGDGVLSYSVGARASLNESALLETDGICNGVDIDWNKNGVIDAAAVAADITGQNHASGDGSYNVISDFNDWANIKLGYLIDADGAPLAPPEVVTEQPVPASAR